MKAVDSHLASPGTPQPSEVRSLEGVAGSEMDLLSGTLGYAIKRAQMRSVEMLYGMLSSSVLTPARMTALSLIGQQSGITQSNLAEHLNVNRASVVKVIDALESTGFVERRATEGDRRSYSLTLTYEGLQELQRLRKAVTKFEEAIAVDLTADERCELIRLLEKVAISPPISEKSIS